MPWCQTTINTHYTSVQKIVSSPQQCSKFHKILKETYGDKTAPSSKMLADLMVIHNVVMRWNYTHAMMEQALLLMKVSQDICSFFEEFIDMFPLAQGY